jgi:hypothetical protein
MPRWVLLSFVAVLLGAVVLVVTDTPLPSLPWRPGVTAANVARIHPGMTMREVEALLGGPGAPSVRVGGAGGWSERHQWDGARGKAEVWMRADLTQPEGRVQSAHFRPRDGMLARLRARLGLRRQ